MTTQLLFLRLGEILTPNATKEHFLQAIMIRTIKAVIYTGQILCGAILLLSIFGLVGIVNVKLHKGREEAGHLEFK